jgi:hypothetical protein
MRRFMVHLVTEVEFEDGDEASDKTVQNYQKQLSETVRSERGPRALAPDSQGRPGSRVSRSQKSEPSSSNPLTCGLNHAQQARPANDARQHGPAQLLPS